uniref:Cysteine-rich venom protein latisemin-like n=1 Tax=Crassostrea virginica TaxID=6565 RepID=A0A8B8BY61_CRAVI|nr:cysteine-rich venom protein latisemin-like [Crassostrea virginica]
MHLLPMSEIMKTISTLALLCVCFMGVWSRDEPTGPVEGRMMKRQSNSEDQEFLNAHNNKRRIVSPTAANMKEMKWSQELATIARNYAQKCQFAHNTQRSSQSSTFSYVGENLYIGPGSPSELVTAWDDEKSDYFFSSNTCNGVCGHYTQVVWYASEYLGCARVQCGTNYYLSVCNYGPGGNFNNLRPYTSGTPCSQCPSGYSCNNKLCSKSTTTSNPCNPNPCLNGGTCSQSSSGSAVCACVQGWTGSLCQTQVSGGLLLHKCDFETGFCLGKSGPGTVSFFRTQSYFGIAAPQGSYFTALASSSTTRSYAFLVSMVYLPESDVRVEFQYTTYGTGQIYFSYGQGETTQYTTLFTSSGDNRTWKTRTVTIPAGKNTFYYFTGYVGGSGFGVVAVDNVRVTGL